MEGCSASETPITQELAIMSRIASPRALAALGIATAIALAGGIEVSSAQTGPRPPPNLQNQQEDPQYGRGDDGQYGGRSDLRGGRGFGGPQNMLDRRLAFLHTRLGITPAQERAWTAFSGVLNEQANDRMRDRGRDFDGRRGIESVIDRLEDREHRLMDRSAGLDRVIGALRPLYASFSEEQKRNADRLMFMPRDERGFADGRGRNRGGPRDRFEDRQDRDYR
jgi:hypothetical protein